MSAIKDKIAAIDGFGRSIAASVNERIDAEELVGQSPATIRRVEELIASVQAATAMFEDNALGVAVMASDFAFVVMKGGVAARPFVTLAGYTGRVGP